MTPAAIATIAAATTVAGAAAGWRAVRRPRMTLRRVRARHAPPPPGTVTPDRSLRGRLGGVVASGPVGRWVEDRLSGSLALVPTSLPAVIGRALVTMAVSLVVVVLGLSTLISSGVLAASPLPWILVPVVPALLGWRVVSEVRTRAMARRRDLRRVVNDFVQLLAVALTTNRSVEDALAFAADAGDGEGFDLLRRTIDTARPMGITVWDALAAMSDTYDLPELRGLTTSLRRQAGVGVSVAATVRTEARALRARQLLDLAERADRANADLSLPTMGMVFGMVAFLAYPVVTQVTQAFA